MDTPVYLQMFHTVCFAFLQLFAGCTIMSWGEKDCCCVCTKRGGGGERGGEGGERGREREREEREEERKGGEGEETW